MRAMLTAAQSGDPQFDILVGVKVRPVLVLSPVLAPYDEVIALRLRTLDKLDDERERERVRSGDDRGLFYLRPDRFPGLRVENAAIVTALLRLPTSALDTSTELGALDDDGLRSVHERFASAHGLRLDALVLQRLAELKHRLDPPG